MTDDEATDLLDRALAEDASAIRVIRALHVDRDRDAGLALCCALRERTFAGPVLDVPNACRLDARAEAHGTKVSVRGFAVLLDASRRWWVAGLVAVDGVPTAIVRAYGREGDGARQVMLAARCKREYRRLLSLGALEWSGFGRGGCAGLEALQVQRGPRDPWSGDAIEAEPWHKPEDGARELETEWQGWTPGMAVAAHRLGLTRWGCGTWM